MSKNVRPSGASKYPYKFLLLVTRHLVSSGKFTVRFEPTTTFKDCLSLSSDLSVMKKV